MATGILSGVIVEGIKQLALISRPKLRALGKGEARTPFEDYRLLKSIKDTLSRTADLDLLLPNTISNARLRLFLESPETERTIRELFSDALDDTQYSKTTKELKDQFTLSLSQYLGFDATQTTQAGNSLFEGIERSVKVALDASIREGDLTALEAKNIARHRGVINEIQGIKSFLEFLRGHTDVDPKEISDYEKHYRGQVKEACRQIIVPHFDRESGIEIEKIFVEPNFYSSLETNEPDRKELSVEQLVFQIDRTVLLGDPGGGKSTFAQKVCFDLSKRFDKRLARDRLLTPVLVVLRDYSARKKKDNVSILRFIEDEASSKYQLPKPPQGGFEYLLNAGHLLLIFDGLDELLEPSHRREISNDVDLFCSLYPSVPVLVTSRRVGYDKAPLDEKRFQKYEIAPFNNSKVSEYAEKWFSHAYSEAEVTVRSRAFLQESNVVQDLRSNPLMLALMCNLYKGTGFIPRNRPEVYRKCSEMLFDHWDKSRGIWSNYSVSYPKFLLGNLAFWIFSDESLQSGVPERELIRKSTKFLMGTNFEVDELAEKAATEFIQHCRGRAWVFTDVGTTEAGERLYKFTHKTFLEYFTALYTVRNHSTSRKLWVFLRPKIRIESWDVVAQLSLQMIHENVEGAYEDLISSVVNEAKNDSSNCWEYLSFAARCLQFASPSPEAIRNIAKESMRAFMERTPPVHVHSSEELLAEIRSAPPDVAEIMGGVFSKIFGEEISKNDSAATALEILYWMNFPRFGETIMDVQSEGYKYWTSLRLKLLDDYKEQIIQLARRDFRAFTLASTMGAIGESEFSKYYPPHYFFLRLRSRVFPTISKPSFSEIVVFGIRANSSH
ncbi:MAG: NACHT domain-containing protein, partial [Thaumarchaeota archaeon]|nr:NACHT domain-containing protein [Nitrososphaerota archaeon]